MFFQHLALDINCNKKKLLPKFRKKWFLGFLGELFSQEILLNFIILFI